MFQIAKNKNNNFVIFRTLFQEPQKHNSYKIRGIKRPFTKIQTVFVPQSFPKKKHISAFLSENVKNHILRTNKKL